MVSPGEVESGRACNCTCPGCSAPLIAKKGGQNVWHFAHDGLACASGAETALHLMAKQILQEDRTIQLPAVEVSISATDALGELQTVSTTLTGAVTVEYGTVELEVLKDNRRPDAVASGGDISIEHRIEVFVRHAVDSTKASELEALDCACYEICLDDISAQIARAELREAVIAAPHRIRWISYPGMAAARRDLKLKLRRLLDAVAQKKADDDAHSAAVYASLAEEDRQEKAEWARRVREKKQAEHKVARANATFKSASSEEKRAFLRAKLRLPGGPVPAILNKRVSGDGSFGVPRDVWQADVFRKFIFGGRRREIDLSSVLEWLRLRYAIAPEFPNAANIALWKYFAFLKESGFVHHVGRQCFRVLHDAAPWLEASVRISGSWFWAPGAYSCSHDELEEANACGGFALTRPVLTAILQRLRIEHRADGQPDDVALSIAQRIEISPMVVLDLLARAGAVTNLHR